MTQGRMSPLPTDIRAIGFADRTPLSQALAWIDAHASVLRNETICVEDAIGRTAALSCLSRMDRPVADTVAADGYAVRAADTEGASDYNPVPLTLLLAESTEILPPGSASLAVSGTPLPSGADAILSFGAAERSGPAALDVLSPVGRGVGVDRRGSELRAGMQVGGGGRRLRPQDIALLAATGETRIAVVRRPRVRLVVAGPKAGEPDALTPMLRALVARDGGIADVAPPADARRPALAQAISRTLGEIDLVLVAGRSGAGMDDEAPLAIGVAGGSLDIHGIAMRPGESAGLGQIGKVMALLLPGAPLACLVSYDMLAARAVRRMAGLRGTSPYPVVEAVLDRKIVSAIGSTDLVRVSISEGRATPLGSAGHGGLVSAARADGFVIVPETSEGHAPGATVRVHLYDDQNGESGA